MKSNFLTFFVAELWKKYGRQSLKIFLIWKNVVEPKKLNYLVKSSKSRSHDDFKTYKLASGHPVCTIIFLPTDAYQRFCFGFDVTDSQIVYKLYKFAWKSSDQLKPWMTWKVFVFYSFCFFPMQSADRKRRIWSKIMSIKLKKKL